MNLIRYVIDYAIGFYNLIIPPASKHMTEKRKREIARDVMDRYYQRKALEDRCDEDCGSTDRN